jgi:hypothetical protein
MVERSCAELHEDFPVAGHRLRDVLVAKDLGATVLVDTHGLHAGAIVA